MQALISKMRSDFVVVAKERRASGEWTADHETEIGLAIKAAIATGNNEDIAMWARWLSDAASWACAYNLIVRGAEVAMRAKAAEEKAKRAGASK